MVTKHNSILDKDPMKMTREDRKKWEQALVEENIKPRLIGYSDTEKGAKTIIGKKKRCHIQPENGVFFVIQAKSR